MQVKNIVVGSKYTDKQGTEKTKWTTIGTAFIKDDNKISGKIEQIPLNWDGQFILFDRDTQQRPSQQTSQYQQQPAPIGTVPNSNIPLEITETEIPF